MTGPVRSGHDVRMAQTTVVTDKGRSENLAALAEYSNAMFAGDEQAVFEFWSPDFVSHVTERVNPDMVGTDVRGHELEWWTQVRNAFPDMTFTRRPAHRVGRPHRLELDGQGHPHRHRVLRRRAVRRAGRDQRHRDPAHARRQGRRALGRPALPGRPRPPTLTAPAPARRSCGAPSVRGGVRVRLPVTGSGGPRIQPWVFRRWWIEHSQSRFHHAVGPSFA